MGGFWWRSWAGEVGGWDLRSGDGGWAVVTDVGARNERWEDRGCANESGELG